MARPRWSAEGLTSAIQERDKVLAVVAADHDCRRSRKRTGMPMVDAAPVHDPVDPAERIEAFLFASVFFIAGRSRRAAIHAFDALLAKDRAVFGIVEGGGELGEVFGRGDPAAMRVHRFQMPAAVLPGCAFAQVAMKDRFARARLVVANFNFQRGRRDAICRSSSR